MCEDKTQGMHDLLHITYVDDELGGEIEHQFATPNYSL